MSSRHHSRILTWSIPSIFRICPLPLATEVSTEANNTPQKPYLYSALRTSGYSMSRTANFPPDKFPFHQSPPRLQGVG